MIKQYKITTTIPANLYHWLNFEIPEGTVITQSADIYKVMNPMVGICAEIPEKEGYYGIPYNHISPLFSYKKSILLLHGFNSGPGGKAEIISNWLLHKKLNKKVKLIAPQLHNNPRLAIRQIAKIIQDNYGDIHVIGTSLGGFYANYIRACNYSDHIKVHSINPSWEPGKTLKRELNKKLLNFKTGNEWTLNPKYLNYLKEIETQIDLRLLFYSGNHYTIHLADNDELLDFSDMMQYFEINNVKHQKYFYHTHHRFEKMEELLSNIQHNFSG